MYQLVRQVKISLKLALLGMGVIALSLLLGCGKNKIFPDHSNDYLQAESEPPLKIPAKVNAGSFSEEYQIPQIPEGTTKK